MGNILHWFERSLRSCLALSSLLAALQSWAEVGQGELSLTLLLGNMVCPPGSPARDSLEAAAGSRYRRVKKKTLPEKPALFPVRAGLWKNTLSLFSMKRKKEQSAKTDFLKGKGELKIDKAAYSPLHFPLQQKKGEGKRKEVGEEVSCFNFFLIKGKFELEK